MQKTRRKYSSALELFKIQAKNFITQQLNQILLGGWQVFIKKLRRIPFFIVAFPTVVVIRLIRPWFLVRIGSMISTRIGHFAANTEIYLCERDAEINLPKQCHVDLFYVSAPICNQQLLTMWKRTIRIWPEWILQPVFRMNQLLPGGSIHEVPENTSNDRDVHNLLDNSNPHLEFTEEEKALGEAGLRSMEIPQGGRLVCLLVRDSAYLESHLKNDWRYHNYRDSDIKNYVLASEALADQGYYVIRMGVKTRQPIQSNNPKVIDYSNNGMRSDFMDIFLGAKCEFCISTSSGWDAVPIIFRKPVVFVNFMPMAYFIFWSYLYIGITKHHYWRDGGQELTLKEIFSSGIGFTRSTNEFINKGVELVENSPEEIRDVVIEMSDRLNGSWQSNKDDEDLQLKFRGIFPADAKNITGRPLHGKLLARYGANFLRSNPNWLK